MFVCFVVLVLWAFFFVLFSLCLPALSLILFLLLSRHKSRTTIKQNNTNNDDAAGLKKPSPGVIIQQDASLDSLVDAKIELYWPDDGLWYKAEVLSLNARARNAKVLYATGDVETLELDEIINEGHLNVCAK